ncbi:NAD-dependent epimerase/dehydratase-like protein [Amylocarpus encephaloides]|uniref:NAD-dependent epimerase/dehydratase-like protein n=1 Tax=Amylocarpus encephaloides TaxID=45428 RepID=A0A9P8C9U6_9HELO|nr:NAD-dependent epimerase/dehydratase-like protein [Amylocarpus encephaloides]
MRVLIIGGSGRTGKLAIEELLSRGHTVTALVRTPTTLKAKPGLTIVQGTPLKRIDVTNAFKIHSEAPEVVLVTLSAPRENDSPFAKVISPRRMMADSNANVTTVMKENGSCKIVVMQALGVGNSWGNLNWAMQLLMKKSNMIYQYDDHNLVAQEVSDAGVSYVFVRPARLEEGAPKPVKVNLEDGRGVGMMGSITRESVARWLVTAVENNTWDGQAPVLTN